VKEYSVILEEYSDVWLEHLNELEIVYFGYYELEVTFVDFILARSPNLKKVVLLQPQVFDRDEELEMLETLTSAPRPPNASPVKIVLKTNSRFEVFWWRRLDHSTLSRTNVDIIKDIRVYRD